VPPSFYRRRLASFECVAWRDTVQVWLLPLELCDRRVGARGEDQHHAPCLDARIEPLSPGK